MLPHTELVVSANLSTIAFIVLLVLANGATVSALTSLPEPDFQQLKSGQFQGILHCSGPLFNVEEHDGYLAAFPATRSFMVRQDMNLVLTGRFTFKEILDNVEANMDRYANEVPLLSVVFKTSLADGNGVGMDPEVAAGDFDQEIMQIAQLVKSRDKTVFMRIGPEFNGYWNGYTPEFFPKAFKRFVDIFKAEGVVNAIFMWNYKAISDAQEIAPYIDFYPGDDYVDWWSIDLFSGDFLNAAIQQKVNTFLADAVAHGKPVVIPESAPSKLDIGAPMAVAKERRGGRKAAQSSPQTTWDTWFVPYFDLINTDSNIKAFCYSNRDFFKNDVKLKEWGNLRIDQSALKALYQKELFKPQYIHSTAAPIFQIDTSVEGSWFDPSVEGQGLLMDYFPGVNKLFIGWFTFDPAGGAKLANASVRWITAVLDVTGDTASGAIFSTTDGAFNSPVPTPVNAEVGTMSIQFSGCDAATMSFTLAAPDNRVGTMAIVPLGMVVDTNFNCTKM